MSLKTSGSYDNLSKTVPAQILEQNAPPTKSDQVFAKIFQNSIYPSFFDIPKLDENNRSSCITRHNNEVHIPVKTTIKQDQCKQFPEWQTSDYYKKNPKITANLILKVVDNHLDQQYEQKMRYIGNSGFAEIAPLFNKTEIDTTKKDWEKNLSPELGKLIREGRSIDASYNTYGIVWEIQDPHTPSNKNATNDASYSNDGIVLGIENPQTPPNKNATNKCCITS